jgi:hypothetical protein
MSDTFIAPEVLTVYVSGALTAETVPQRLLLPYPCSVIGVQISVTVAPTGANIICDVLHGAAQIAPGSMTSLWWLNNVVATGPPATVDNRPTIVVSTFDQAARTVSAVTVQSKGIPSVPITTTAYNEMPWLAIPDPNTTGATTFEGAQPVFETEENPVELESDNDGTDTAFTGGANWPQEAANAQYGYTCLAGDVLVPKITQIGSTVAGSNLTMEIWVQRI